MNPGRSESPPGKTLPDSGAIQLKLFEQLQDVSIVVPVFECAQRLSAHQKMLQELAPLVRQMVWVATHSSDDSHVLAAQAARQTGGIYKEVPAGLYGAWNEGIRQVSSTYVYISTVGENINLAGLRTMRDLLLKHQADVCFSPPQILPKTPERIRRTRHWPIFRFRRALGRYHRSPVPVPLLARLQILSGISCVLGSCASALFRASSLQARPFPVDFHHYGDTAWFYRHLCNLRTVYLDQFCSTFHVHDFSRRKIFPHDLRRCVDLLAADYLAKYPRSGLPRWALDLQQAREKLDHIRMPHPYRYWWMSPAAWGWRFRREWLNLKIRLNMEWQLGRTGPDPRSPTTDSHSFS